MTPEIYGVLFICNSMCYEYLDLLWILPRSVRLLAQALASALNFSNNDKPHARYLILIAGWVAVGLTFTNAGGAHHLIAFNVFQSVKMREGRPVLVFEVAKSSPQQSSSDIAELAKDYEAAGADALVVPTDAYDTSTGLADLLAVCRAVRCPVVRKDWILHPLQVVYLHSQRIVHVLKRPCAHLPSHGQCFQRAKRL